MLDVSREESDVFQQDVNAKEKYEGEQKTTNVNRMKLGGGKDFPCNANLERIKQGMNEIGLLLGSWLHFLRIQPSGETSVKIYAGTSKI